MTTLMAVGSTPPGMKKTGGGNAPLIQNSSNTVAATVGVNASLLQNSVSTIALNVVILLT